MINFAFNLKTLIAIPFAQFFYETKKVINEFAFNLKTLVSTSFWTFFFKTVPKFLIN